MTGPRDPNDDWPSGPDDDLSWPSRDLDEEEHPREPEADGAPSAGPEEEPASEEPASGEYPSEEPAGTEVPVAAAPTEMVARPDGPEPKPEVWDTRRFGDRRRPTTAEQAVPWLVGLVLALAGIVIVLLALIYSDANGAFGGLPSPSPSMVASASLAPTATPTSSAVQAATPSASPTASPTPAPTYGALEVDYLTRVGGGVAQLIRNNFASSTPSSVVEKASSDVVHYAVAPDGTVAAGIVNGDLLAFQKGKASRKLASGVAGVTFGMDASTVYAVKIARAGTNDTATILAIDFASGKTSTLTTITMAHPASVARSRLNAARFFDDGGADRLYPTSDGNLVLWVDNGGQWRIDPASGSNVPVTRQPVLWSPDGTRRISVAESGTTTTLTLVDTTGAKLASVQMSGLISHLRWSPSGKQVMFTAGLAFSSGGVRMDLWTWDLVNGKKPRQLTSNGASWGAEWLGVAQFWQP